MLLTIQREDPGTAEVRDLIGQLDRYQEALYPAESNHLLPIEVLRAPNVTFLTARLDGQLAACGAVVNQNGEYAEIKRMFVRPEFRGLKIGRGLLDALEGEARTAGLALARLETGIAQPEALRLYERAGYQYRGPFGAYPEDPLCLFMEKTLGAK
jgi:putative acetyltransferase